MQDPAAAAAFQMMKPQFPEQEQLKCPRCDSNNTKFCYYNNYNLSQPRHFCKNCKRYWTKGGSLRNIPVGGGSRKNTKRSSSSSTKRISISSSSTSSATNSSSSTVTATTATVTAATVAKVEVQQPKMDQENRMMDVTGSFSSMLTANDQFGSIMEGLNNSSNESGLKLMHMGGFGENVVDSSGHGLSSDPGLDVQSNGGDPESYWNGSNVVWPDLAIYTPGSTFQ